MTRGHAYRTRPTLIVRAWRAARIDAEMLVAAGTGAVAGVLGVVWAVGVWAP